MDHLYYFCLFFCYAFVRVCLLMPCGHLLGKDCPLVCEVNCHFPIGILGQVWCLIVSIPDICPFPCFGGTESTLFKLCTVSLFMMDLFVHINF